MIGHVTPGLCFYIWCDLDIMYCVRVRPGHEMSTEYFSCSGGPAADSKKCTGTRYTEHVILHPVQSMCDIGRSGASGT
jgi:hypothetical protein